MADAAIVLTEMMRLAVKAGKAIESGPIPSRSRRTESSNSVGISVPRHIGNPLAMYARSRSYYRGILLLAHNKLADEALTLARSLFEDSLRLSILAEMADERERVDALTGWLISGVDATIGLWRAAERLGVGTEHALVVSQLEKMRDSFIEYRRRNGTGRRNAALADSRLEAAATSAGRTDAWWLHDVADQMVHGNLFAHQMRMTSLHDDVLGVEVESDEPGALVDVVAFAIESAIVAHRSMCQLLNLSYATELDRLLDEVEALQDQLKEE